jgi:hypothetical protein
MHLGRSHFVILILFLLSFPMTRSSAATERKLAQAEEVGDEDDDIEAALAEDDVEPVPPPDEPQKATEKAEEPKREKQKTEEIAEDDEEEEFEEPTPAEDTVVEIESSPYRIDEDSGDTISTYLLPYRKRRESWGSFVTVGWSQYSPTEYTPDFTIENFSSYYGNAEGPMMELTVTPKKNFGLGSIGADIGVGYYMNEGKDGSELTLIPVRLGLSLSLDTIFEEPYIVPYGAIGMYTIAYKESTASVSVNGNTLAAMYFSFGLKFQLDWIDSDGDYSSYDEQGMENTFLYVEARNYGVPESTNPDLASPEDEPFQIGAGISLEF